MIEFLENCHQVNIRADNCKPGHQQGGGGGGVNWVSGKGDISGNP